MSLTSASRIAVLMLAIGLFGGVIHAGSSVDRTGYDLEVVAHGPERVLEPASVSTVRIELHNRGSRPWSRELGFAVAYHWTDDDGRVVEWDGVRTQLDGVLGPGESRMIDAALHAPHRSGRYRLQWDVVQEGVLWVSEVDPTPTSSQPVVVAATHSFSLLRVSTPRVLNAGGRRMAELVVRNDGVDVWAGDGSVSLASHWFDATGDVVEWEGPRAPVRRPVEPGGTIVLEGWVEAPPRAGRYAIQWDMVDEGVCWFSERDASPEPLVTVVVLPALAAHPALWSVFSLAVAFWMVMGSRRAGDGSRCELALISWSIASIIVKQVWVLHRSGVGSTLGGLCLTAASALALGLIVVALPQRIRPWTAWAAAFIATVVLFGDLVHLRFFGDLGSAAALRSAGQLGQISDSVVSLLRLGDLWFWTDLIAAAAMVLVVSRSTDRDLPRLRVLLVGAVACVVLLCLGAVLLDRSVSIRQVFHSTQLARQIGVVNLHFFDAWNTLGRGLVVSPMSDAEYEEVVAFFDDRRDSRAGVGPTFGIARGSNLVMIQVESLQAFVVGLRIGGREVTPTLNSLAVSSFTFTNVTDQTEEGRSSDSELATQVSLLPLDRGAAAFLYPGNRFTGIASVLRERGYETLSAVPFDGAFWNRRSTHPAYGYDESLFEGDFAPGETIGWGLNDRDFLAQSTDRLAELGAPWCAYLLTLSLHHPFDGFPDRFKRLDVGRWEGTPFGNYLHTMHHFDAALGDFLDALERRGLTASTVIALWGDHDAGFEWNPEIAEAIGATHDPAGWYLSQKVPLVIHAPGVEASVLVSDLPAGHIDVTPTLLHVMGVDPGPYPFIGRNLLGEPGSGAVVGEYRCWRDDRVLYLRRGPGLGDGECIALETMEQVDAGLCAAGFEDAARQVEISRLVLDHDLQQKLRQSLADRP